MGKAKPFDIPKREVWEAFKRVKANHGAAGVDRQSIADFEVDLSNNLYKLWNRLSSGSYFPPPVRRVDIPKATRSTAPAPLQRSCSDKWHRRWALHHRSDRSLQDLAEMYNPCIRGWINYYSHFYKTQLRPTLKRIDLYVIRWARRKFKRLRRKTKGARDWFDRLRRVNPTLFAHWQLCQGNGRTSGAV